MDKYAVDFAPDGAHWQTAKTGTIREMTEYFTGPEVAEQIALNRFAAVRLVNKTTGKMIAVKPR